MANWRPVGNIITAASAGSGTVVYKQISTTTWGMFLLKGTAYGKSGSTLASGGVQVWENPDPTTGPATHTTFTDYRGRYGVSCKANVQLIVKTYAR